ncbi:PD-(D/E)XK motif protein [Methylorubrum salsuginis]|uniref:Putative PD-(D/E)XK family member n=1 Tax=Methylorubrum salsuginis TaxID=414703 RepID=A0A1I4LJA2_9HYPH|nr:PD-(D/E)XK motif protein [Methylorubrum salsuginis]SFL91085.1 Putative PD-(D/E)XK family member [Methylorubrum salsuginis]
MTPKTAPWDDIAIPNADFNVRQVVGEPTVPCFWGRDSDGSCLFLVELQGDHVLQYRKNAVTVHGIRVDLSGGDPGQQRLVLSLEKQADRDLFESLCRTLVSSLERATDSSSALSITLTQIRRWKAFLSGQKRKLSAEEIRGLFAELAFLSELADQKASTSDAAEAWLGPERSHQDFIFGNTAIEIKSVSGSERNTVCISSEDQLCSLNDRLFLRIYRLSNLSEAVGARSLNEMVASIQAQFADSADIIDSKLQSYGYAPLPDYDNTKYIVSDVRSYHVTGEFPRLVRAVLPAGIDAVAYDIRLESIAPYECDNATVFG